MDFFPLRHGFDLIVKNTFYTVPIEEEEDGRTRGNDGKVGRWDFSLVVGLFSQVYSTGWNRGGGVNTSIPNTCVCLLGDLFTEFTMVNHHHH